MSEIKRFLTGPLPTNTYTIKKDKDNDNVILIDPGPGAEGLFDILLERGERIRAILITHGHADHVDGVAGIKKRALEQNGESIKCYAPKADEKTFSDSDWNSSLMIVGEKKNYEKDVDMWLSDGQEIDFDDFSINIKVVKS
jgi:glyoxylase-like metal-dependent hydrolase (beta-lactamase superfamily II)